MKNRDSSIEISPEVKKALKNSAPVVALESTIISHGMPYPQNIETALSLERTIREKGATPATIAVIEGKIKIGLSEKEIDLLARAKDVRKASRRDLPVVVASKLNAATTVAGTMICASLAGIPIFATGGIGGVHRGAETSFDISADLQELGRTGVTVVCAGAKAILDLPLTLEYLETMGVPVIGYRTDEFPAFYSRSSGLAVDYRLDEAGAIARVMASKKELEIGGGILVTNPIPEEFSMERAKIDRAVEAALIEARRNGIAGKELTPFLLDKIKELTGGESLSANIELVRSNAALAAEIAVAYSQVPAR
ncbi:MAG TPA: pseudouridine-5'-phosphate glycosidase [Sediminispirochaeta sp.]|nr:pseudouridine-5'-phosphate glycosidase [Sediminispirochaeta sp.]